MSHWAARSSEVSARTQAQAKPTVIVRMVLPSIYAAEQAIYGPGEQQRVELAYGLRLPSN